MERGPHLRGLGFRERRKLDRAAADDWAALLPRNAWGFPTRGSFDTDRGTVWRRVPAPIQAAPRWMVPLLAGVGAALIAVAILLQASAGPPRDLRASGVSTTSLVKDVQEPTKQAESTPSTDLFARLRASCGPYAPAGTAPAGGSPALAETPDLRCQLRVGLMPPACRLHARRGRRLVGQVADHSAIAV